MTDKSDFRILTCDEIDLVSGGEETIVYVDAQGTWLVTFDDNGQYLRESLVSDSSGFAYGGVQDFNWGWAAAGAVGGVYIGSEFAGAAAVGIAVAVEYGVIGASTGAVLGPVGVVAGAVIGVAAGYVIYEYGPEIWENTFSSAGTESSPVQNQ